MVIFFSPHYSMTTSTKIPSMKNCYLSELKFIKLNHFYKSYPIDTDNNDNSKTISFENKKFMPNNAHHTHL